MTARPGGAKGPVRSAGKGTGRQARGGGEVLQLSDVSLTYPDGTEALAEVSLRLPPGEFVSLVGPSGCGKSTLLRVASGLLPAGRGRVVNRAAEATGYVFQDATLLPWRTVQRNAELLAELHRIPRAQRRRRATEALERVGLREFAQFRPAALSGGMRMRASLARALVLAPRLLLLDEPFGALDELTRERLGEQLQRLFVSDRFAALLVTHSIAEAVFLSDRVLVMSPRPGRVVTEVTVPFRHPRPPELRFDSGFATVAGRVAAALRARTP